MSAAADTFRVYAGALSTPFRAAVLATLLAGGAAPGLPTDETIPLPSKGDRWIEVRTQNFTLYADAGESKTKQIGIDMEALRAVLVALKRGSPNVPAPTRVYVFKTPQALEPFLPRESGGGRANWASYYRGGWEANYAALSAAWNADPRPSVYYAYIYDFIRANFAKLPLWYEVGIAGYYSTFQTEGDEARTGMIAENKLRDLREALMWIPLDRLFAIDQDSPEYRDPDRRHLYFSETWAFIHYVSRGNEARTPQLGRFVSLLGQGMPQDAAFQQAFGTSYAAMFTELTTYIRNNKRYFYNRAKFSELRPPTDARVTPLTYEQTLVRLGDLVASEEARRDQAERFYQAALAANPADSAALGGLGWLRRQQKRNDEAAALLTKAAEGGSTDYRVPYALGRLRIEELSAKPYDTNAPSAEQRGLLESARTSLRRSIELEPDFAEARVDLGKTYRFEPRDGSVDEGIASLEEARKRLPSRDDVAVDLARLYDRKGEHAKADAVSPTSGAARNATRNATKFETEMKSDFDAKVARVNALIEAGKLDDAVAAVDELIAESGGETRAKLQEERDGLAKTAAHNRAIADFNAAVALHNGGKEKEAVAALKKIAADCPDPEVAAMARERLDRLAKVHRAAPPGK
jgi:Tfp pilus assembly protein PilF